MMVLILRNLPFPSGAASLLLSFLASFLGFLAWSSLTKVGLEGSAALAVVSPSPAEVVSARFGTIGICRTDTKKKANYHKYVLKSWLIKIDAGKNQSDFIKS